MAASPVISAARFDMTKLSSVRGTTGIDFEFPVSYGIRIGMSKAFRFSDVSAKFGLYLAFPVPHAQPGAASHETRVFLRPVHGACQWLNEIQKRGYEISETGKLRVLLRPCPTNGKPIIVPSNTNVGAFDMANSRGPCEPEIEIACASPSSSVTHESDASGSQSTTSVHGQSRFLDLTKG